MTKSIKIKELIAPLSNKGNEAILYHLQGAQEELENFYLGNKNIEVKMQTMCEQNEHLSKQLQGQKERMRSMKLKMEEICSQNNYLIKELENLKNTNLQINNKLNEESILMDRNKFRLGSLFQLIYIPFFYIKNRLQVIETQIQSAMHLKKQIITIKESGLFDEKWYLMRNPDVASQGVDPIMHYIMYGVKEGRNPSRQFDTREYVKSYPELENMYINNPVIHFIENKIDCQKKVNT